MVKRRYLIKQNEGARLVLSITVSIFSSFLFLFCLLQPILLGQAERERYLHSASNLTTLFKAPWSILSLADTSREPEIDRHTVG